MPWFLRSKLRASAFFFIVGTLCAAAFLFYLGHSVSGLLTLLVSFTIVSVAYANKKVRQKNQQVRSVFSLTPSSPRNFDYLVIGEYCKVENQIPRGARTIYFIAPGRTMGAAFTILKHVFSLLKDNGTVVFVVSSKNIKSNKISVFDIPLLHSVTVRRLGLASVYKKARFPLIFSPIRSIKLLFPAPAKNKMAVQGLSDEGIKKFCKERNISVILISD